jgi:hypothetical protein
LHEDGDAHRSKPLQRRQIQAPSPFTKASGWSCWGILMPRGFPSSPITPVPISRASSFGRPSNTQPHPGALQRSLFMLCGFHLKILNVSDSSAYPPILFVNADILLRPPSGSEQSQQNACDTRHPGRRPLPRELRQLSAGDRDTSIGQSPDSTDRRHHRMLQSRFRNWSIPTRWRRFPCSRENGEVSHCLQCRAQSALGPPQRRAARANRPMALHPVQSTAVLTRSTQECLPPCGREAGSSVGIVARGAPGGPRNYYHVRYVPFATEVGRPCGTS